MYSSTMESKTSIMREKQMLKKYKHKYRPLLRAMVRDKRLTPIERLATRLGYMGAGFLMAGQWTVEPILFVMGFCCVLVQVTTRRQWNLVVLQLNGLIAWSIHFFSSL